MAKRMKSKIQPAVQTLVFSGNVDVDEDFKGYIDLSQCVSLMNRRFYRQGLNWAVAGFKLVVRQTSGSDPIFARATVSSLPNTWVMSNAWEKGFRAWMKQQKDALSENESVSPKYLDFKTYMSSDHLDATDNLLPIDSRDVTVTSDKSFWQYSQIVIPEYAGTGQAYEFPIVAIGPNNLASHLSLVDGYAASRGIPQPDDPNTPADVSTDQNWLTAMFNDGTRQDKTVIENLTEEQVHPPYAVEDGVVYTDTQYPAGANNIPNPLIVDETYLTNGTIGLPMVAGLKGGNFPCGLIEFRFNNFNTGADSGQASWDLYVDLVPGTHRGYLVEPMTEM